MVDSPALTIASAPEALKASAEKQREGKLPPSATHRIDFNESPPVLIATTKNGKEQRYPLEPGPKSFLIANVDGTTFTTEVPNNILEDCEGAWDVKEKKRKQGEAAMAKAQGKGKGKA